MSESEVGTSARKAVATGPWGAVVLATVALASILAKLQVNDLAYLLRVGEWMRTTHAVARTDMMTFTVFGRPWLNQQWGSQLVLSVAYDAGGWKTLIFLRALLVIACFGATYRMTRSTGSSPVVAAACVLAAYTASALVPGTLTLRPQLLALPLLVVAIWIVRTRASHPGRLWFLPLIGVIWANTHGSFPLLTILLGIAFIHDTVTRALTWRLTATIMGISVVAPLISPWGLGTYRYVWDVATSHVVRSQITEWQPLYTAPFVSAAFFALVALGCVVYFKRGRRKPTLEEALGLATFTTLAILSSRNILWWSVFVPPVVGGLVAGWRPGSTWPPRATMAVSATLVSAVALGSVFVASQPGTALLTEAPQGLTGALSTTSSSGERVFDEWWGSWFEFALPDRPMFTDARVEIFPDSVWEDYDRVVGAERGWHEVLDGWDISVIVINRHHDLPLTDTLMADPRWIKVYEDADGIIFERTKLRAG